MNMKKVKKYLRLIKKQKHLVNSAVLLLIFCAFVVILMRWEKSLEDEPAPTDPTPSESISIQDSDQTLPTTTEPTEIILPQFAPRRINFLLVGRDYHAEGENGRSDSMILCSVDTGAKKVTMISFLRDIYLRIPGHGSNRLNASYSWGGTELLKETMKENFDVDIDVSLEIDFEGFQAIIDYLGGVDVSLTDQEADYLNKNHDGWTLVEGPNQLDGTQALAYSRIRKLDSDFGRTQRQRNVLVSLMEEYKSASMQEMLHITDEFLNQSTSDHSDEELIGLALELYSMMPEYEIITHRVPADGTYSYETIRGMSVVDIDFEENLEMLSELLDQESAD